MAVLVIIPLIIALIFKIISCKVNDVDKKEIWLQRAKWALGEYALYVFLSFSYLAYLSLFIQVKYLGSDMLSYLGVGVGAIFVVAGVLFMILYAKAETYFIEFTEKFH